MFCICHEIVHEVRVHYTRPGCVCCFRCQNQMTSTVQSEVPKFAVMICWLLESDILSLLVWDGKVL